MPAGCPPCARRWKRTVVAWCETVRARSVSEGSWQRPLLTLQARTWPESSRSMWPGSGWPTLAPAQQLVLQCARVAGEPVRPSAPIDWTAVEREAVHHGLLPLVAARVQSVAPPDVLRRMQTQARRIRLENLRLCAILLGLRQSFVSAGIPFLTFKGPVAAADLYGDLALRTFLDLDILVPPQHALRAADLLRQLGYRPQFELRPDWQRYYFRTR